MFLSGMTPDQLIMQLIDLEKKNTELEKRVKELEDLAGLTAFNKAKESAKNRK
jgi:hypothetical protein